MNQLVMLLEILGLNSEEAIKKVIAMDEAIRAECMHLSTIEEEVFFTINLTKYLNYLDAEANKEI